MGAQTSPCPQRTLNWLAGAVRRLSKLQQATTLAAPVDKPDGQKAVKKNGGKEAEAAAMPEDKNEPAGPDDMTDEKRLLEKHDDKKVAADQTVNLHDGLVALRAVVEQGLQRINGRADEALNSATLAFQRILALEQEVVALPRSLMAEVGPLVGSTILNMTDTVLTAVEKGKHATAALTVHVEALTAQEAHRETQATMTSNLMDTVLAAVEKGKHTSAALTVQVEALAAQAAHREKQATDGLQELVAQRVRLEILGFTAAIRDRLAGVDHNVAALHQDLAALRRQL